jgi:hypothetical protein
LEILFSVPQLRRRLSNLLLISQTNPATAFLFPNLARVLVPECGELRVWTRIISIFMSKAGHPRRIRICFTANRKFNARVETAPHLERSMDHPLPSRPKIGLSFAVCLTEKWLPRAALRGGCEHCGASAAILWGERQAPAPPRINGLVDILSARRSRVRCERRHQDLGRDEVSFRGTHAVHEKALAFLPTHDISRTTAREPSFPDRIGFPVEAQLSAAPPATELTRLSTC